MGYPEDQYMELDAEVYFVRQVAPNKDMYCLSLNLPRSVAYANDDETSEAGLKRKQDDSSEAELETSDPKVSKADN
ncbi:hypothetical protein H4S02_007896 [Coemansia sp. RSA 2611]|nr:hypothetical protein H4S02_007896 [Coemansia sp. RSA 2611]